MSIDYNKKALEVHKNFGGKLETNSKLKLTNREELSVAYTPGVAEVCKVIGSDESDANIYTLKKNTIAIVSDGSAILGLGNLGASAAIPVMEGKACILKEFSQVDAFPICIRSQNVEDIINIIKNIEPVFGGINLEDIAAPKCFEIESRLREELSIPVMHDDQWGAATVTLTALINSLKLTNKNKENVKVVLSGVGAAGVATAKLLIEYGVKNIIFVDSKGVVNKNRQDLNNEKIELLKSTNEHNVFGSLEQAIVNADVFIGLSKPDTVTSDMVKTMNDKPVIFALANPTPEIMPDIAKSAGAFIVATGRSDYDNQINNSLVFPGFWKGMLVRENKKYNNDLFIKIAIKLAEHVKDLSVNKILPDMFDGEVVDVVYRTVLEN